MHRLGAIFLILGALLIVPGAATRDANAETALAQLLPDLKKGGYVIYFRHAETGSSASDMAQAVIGDCSTQRNLNDTGRRQATAIGEAFRNLQIPVGNVLSSELCRCWQHAEAMFGVGGYEVTERLTLPGSYPQVTDADRARNNQHLAGLLAETPAAGTNTVLVSHGANVLLLTGFHPGVQGEAVVFRPDGKGGFDRIASVLPDDWIDDAKGMANPSGSEATD
jgi:phosphohistidine phosphatase SixA